MQRLKNCDQLQAWKQSAETDAAGSITGPAAQTTTTSRLTIVFHSEAVKKRKDRDTAPPATAGESCSVYARIGPGRLAHIPCGKALPSTCLPVPLLPVPFFPLLPFSLSLPIFLPNARRPPQQRPAQNVSRHAAPSPSQAACRNQFPDA
jgi:hypothetical protein